MTGHSGKKKFLEFLFIFFIIIVLGGIEGRADSAKPEIVDVEKIVAFTGALKITLPWGEVKKLSVGEELFELPEKTLVEVISGESTGLVSGNSLVLKTGQVARIIKPVISVERIIRFTGILKITLPTGEEIQIKTGEALPDLPAGSLIDIISGDLTVISQGEQTVLNPGEIAQLETELEGETELEEIEVVNPASPTW